MKNCKFCNKFPVFSHDYCRFHQWMRTDEDYKKYKKLKKDGVIPNKKISQESPKRKKEHKYYSQICKEMEAEIRAENDGKIYCFFSGDEINEPVVWHHLKGRTGGNYLDREWLVPAINERHNEYHFKRVEWLMKQSWYPGFLIRLKAKSDLLYRFELHKQNKAELQFEE